MWSQLGLHPKHQRYLCVAASIWGSWPWQTLHSHTPKGYCSVCVCACMKEKERMCKKMGEVVNSWQTHVKFMYFDRRSQHGSWTGHQMKQKALKVIVSCFPYNNVQIRDGSRSSSYSTLLPLWEMFFFFLIIKKQQYKMFVVDNFEVTKLSIRSGVLCWLIADVWDENW